MASSHPGMSRDEDFPVQTGDLLSSTTCKYVVMTFLGEGSFGKIAKCLKLDTTEAVAIKILKGPMRIRNAEKEVAMLKKLCDLDPDKNNFARWHDYFLHKGHPCLVFEVLDIDLFDFMEQKKWNPLPLSSIRPITQQLAVALKAFKSIGLMHGDLKPENIMLVDCVQQPLRVKIIDFGTATSTAKAECSGFQTLSFMTPEVLLGLPCSEAIDMWSLGCVMVELFQGIPLYTADNKYDMIRYIMQTHGEIPHHMVDAGVNSCVFFSKKANIRGSSSWSLKTPLEYKIGSRISPEEEVDKRILCSLDDLVKLCPPGHLEQIEDTKMFVDLMKRMLTLDAARRITPSEVLQHPFVTMKHLLERYPHSFYLNSCSKAMDICTRQEQSFKMCATAEKMALVEEWILTDCETETPVTPAMQEVKAPSPPSLPQESKAVDVQAPMRMFQETKETQTSSSLIKEIKPLVSQQQVNAADKVPTCLVQEPANVKPAGPVGCSLKGHCSVQPQKERKKHGCFPRFFPTRVNKVEPAGPESCAVKDFPPTTTEKERENHGCFSWLLCPIRQGKQRLTQWLEKQRGLHCRPSQNKK